VPSILGFRKDSNEPLETRNPHGIGGGYLLREIVVDTPTKASSRNRQRACIVPDIERAVPRQNDAARHNGQQPGRNTCADVFMKNGPSYRCAKDSFQI
jgi:hypothetical protein